MTTPPTSGALRVARGTVVAVLTAVLGVGAHVVAGGIAPHGPVLIGVFAGLLVGCLALSRQRWTPRPLLAVFLLAQGAVHAVSMAQHPHAATHGAAMVVSHLAAAAVLVLVVLYGERTLADLIDHLWMRAREVGVRRAPVAARPLASVPHRRPRTAFVPADVLGRAPPVVG